ncbi:MAG TPA: YfhO family protein [Chloroflexota bacterium]|nr:YfhO family protein [Chloroflexota bacterium]
MLIFFWKILVLGRAIGGLDVLEYFYPYRAYAQQAVDAGRLPLWNPDHFGGAPFLANIQTAVFYPLTVLFYVFSFPTAYTWSVALHVFLGGLFTYLFARQSLQLGRAGALIGALAFAFGGFFGGQMGHLNQLSAAVWLPALLLCWDKAIQGRLLYVVLGALTVGIQFLAGHSQESYLMLVALLLYAAFGALRSLRRGGWVVAPVHGLAMAVILALGVALAAVQLVPTTELTAWSIRADGLTYDVATTFSLPGTMLLNALLPPFGNRAMVLQPGATEFLGYVSVTGLVLALAALAYSRRRATYFFAALAAMALFLAVGKQNPLYPALFKLVPGFNLLRVPARWLFLYDFGAAMLAALGAEALLEKAAKRSWRPLAVLAMAVTAIGAALARLENLPPLSTRLAWGGFGVAGLAAAFGAVYLSTRGSRPIVQRWRIGVAAAMVALVGGELWLAGQSLDYNHPTAASLFSQPIGTLDFLRQQPPGYRVLSVAQDTFVPAIEPSARQQLGPTLGKQDLFSYLSYYKLREILEPNTPMAAGVASIDGYDGGLLPLSRYVRFKDLLTERPSAPDDRIRFVIKWLPNRGLLDLSGVRYVLTDALSDKAVDGVNYDLSSFIHLDAQHPTATLTFSQPVPASAVGSVLATKPAALAPDTPVATLTLADSQGTSTSLPLRAGGAPVGQLPYAEKLPTRSARAKLGSSIAVSSVTVTLQSGAASDVFLNGLALVDASGHAYSPLVAPGPEMKRVYQRDVKIYRNPAALGPAFLAHDAQFANDAGQAATAMASGLDPPSRAVLEANPRPPLSRSLLGRITGKLRRMLPAQSPAFNVPDAWLEPQPAQPGDAPDKVTVDDFRPEHITVRTTSARAGFLVLTQSYYPGWEATVDGVPAHLMAADLLFQAVHVPAGQHTVQFTFKPRSVQIGEAISFAALGVCLVGLILVWIGRRRP